MLLHRFASDGLWSSLREIERLRQQLSRGYGSDTRSAAFPAVNVWTSQDAALVTSEIPGLDPNDLDISVLNRSLTIKGSREPEALKDGETYHRQERGYGQFARTLEFPFNIDAERVSAQFSDGVLSITLPRAEADKSRKISVQSS